MRLLHWNINGLRSICKKEIADGITFKQFIHEYDIIVLNETKIDSSRIGEIGCIGDGYHMYHAFADKKGYSGVSILTKQAPLRELKPSFKDNEGRVVILEYSEFILVGVYVPNSGQTIKPSIAPKRIGFRTTTWDPQFQLLCSKLEKKKPLIVLGDLNVAYTEMDLANPTKNKYHAGFTDAERNNFGILLESTRLVDIWRYRHPSKVEYTYFDYRTRARDRNAGWRIDYALISKEILDQVVRCNILSDIKGSDHVPLELILSYGSD
jgi:exodeoxyribonuclease III